MKKVKKIETVGRRRLAVSHEDGRVQIEITINDKHIATLDLEPHAAAELELAIHEQRMIAKKSK